MTSLALVAAVALSAATADAPAPPGAGTTIRLMHIQVAETTGAAVAKAVKRFEAATGATVEVQAIKNEQFKQKLGVTLPSNSPPDVFHTWGGGGLADYAEKGLVAPLPAGFASDGISEAAMAFCRVGDQAYAAPADVSIVAFWYRKGVFEKHGVVVPATMADLRAASRTLREAGVIPIALGNVAHWPGAFYHDYLVVRHGWADRYVAESNVANAPAPLAKDAFARTVRPLVAADAFNDAYNGIGYDRARGLLLRQEDSAAMTLMGSWLLSYAISDRPEVVSDLGVFPFPTVSGADSQRPDDLLGGVNAAYAVSAKCAEKELAFRLVEFLTNAAAAKDWAATGRIPARKVELTDAPAALTDAMKLIEKAPRIHLYFDQALDPAIAEKHKEYTQSLFVGPLPDRVARAIGTTDPAAAAPACPLRSRPSVALLGLAALLLAVLALRAVFRRGERTSE
jgi:raffinose/stachyose/melibiose transport system substrate-binding protein